MTTIDTTKPNTVANLCHDLNATTNRSTAESILGKLLSHCAQLANDHGIDAEQCLKREVRSAMIGDQDSPSPHQTTT